MGTPWGYVTVGQVSTTETLTESTLDIEGMTCASCVNRVTKALTRVDGVVDASVNLATETAAVTYDPQAVDAAALTRRRREGRVRRDPAAPDPGRGAERAGHRPDRDAGRPPRHRDRQAPSPLAGRAGDRARADGADVPAALHRHHGLADAAGARRGDRRAVLGRPGHLPPGLGQPPAPHHQHGHAGRARHRGGLRVRRVRGALARPRRAVGAAAAPLLRERADRRRADPDGALAGAEGQEAHGLLAPRAGRPGSRDRAGASRCGRGRRTSRRRRRRRPRAGATGGEAAGRRRRHRRPCRPSTSRC